MTNTLFVGKVYLRFDSLASTHDYAIELLAKSRPAEGTVVHAVSQSAGRGQFGSRWESSAGKNLTLSIIFYPNWLPIERQFYLNMAVALAVRDTVEAFYGLNEQAYPVAVKWPNDIYIQNGKTAGILIQNSLSGGKIQSTVLGIGLNVNQTEFEGEAPNPVSPALLSGHDYDLELVTGQLCQHLEQRYLQLKTGHATEIRAEYLRHLYRRDETCHFSDADGTMFEGTIRDIGPDGRLLVERAGEIRAYDLKQIRMII